MKECVSGPLGEHSRLLVLWSNTVDSFQQGHLSEPFVLFLSILPRQLWHFHPIDCSLLLFASSKELCQQCIRTGFGWPCQGTESWVIVKCYPINDLSAAQPYVPLTHFSTVKTHSQAYSSSFYWSCTAFFFFLLNNPFSSIRSDILPQSSHAETWPYLLV